MVTSIGVARAMVFSLLKRRSPNARANALAHKRGADLIFITIQTRPPTCLPLPPRRRNVSDCRRNRAHGEISFVDMNNIAVGRASRREVEFLGTRHARIVLRSSD